MTERMLVVVAHPDDESFGCGSILAHAAVGGVDTIVCCATRGEAGSPIPMSGGPRLAAVRERELRAAADLLDVGRVVVLDYEDSGMPARSTIAPSSRHRSTSSRRRSRRSSTTYAPTWW